MSSTIAKASNVQTGKSVSISENGSRYDVTYHGEAKEGCRTYFKLSHAYDMYERLCEGMKHESYTDDEMLSILDYRM